MLLQWNWSCLWTEIELWAETSLLELYMLLEWKWTFCIETVSVEIAFQMRIHCGLIFGLIENARSRIPSFFFFIPSSKNALIWCVRGAEEFSPQVTISSLWNHFFHEQRMELGVPTIFLGYLGMYLIPPILSRKLHPCRWTAHVLSIDIFPITGLHVYACWCANIFCLVRSR